MYHFSNLASRSIICQFMMILAGLSAQLNICWVVHVHTVQALSIHHPVRPHHHHHQQGKRAERSDRRERRGGRPAVARRDGRITLGRWNARQLPCRYGGEEVTGFMCTIQEQVIPIPFIIDLVGHACIYTCATCTAGSCIPTTVF